MTTAQANTVTAIGIGIDTSRYGHHVSFLRDDLQPAAEPLTMTETREGYDTLLRKLQELKRRYANVEFQIRLDEAGQYAANLKTFLYALPLEKTVSIDCDSRNLCLPARGQPDEFTYVDLQPPVHRRT